MTKVKTEEISINKRDRIEILLNLFKKHIGFSNSVSRKKIFESIYGKSTRYSNLQIFYLWSKITQDMNWIRKNTYCFIANCRMESGFKYFVVKDKNDAEYYISSAKNRIERITLMLNRCNTAVRYKYYEKFLKEK